MTEQLLTGEMGQQAPIDLALANKQLPHCATLLQHLPHQASDQGDLKEHSQMTGAYQLKGFSSTQQHAHGGVKFVAGVGAGISCRQRPKQQLQQALVPLGLPHQPFHQLASALAHNLMQRSDQIMGQGTLQTCSKDHAQVR